MRRGIIVEAWGEFIGRIPWEWFLSFTIDPKRATASQEYVSREIFRCCNEIVRACRGLPDFAYAVERHKSGLWHGHAVLVGTGLRELTPFESLWRIRNGTMVSERVYEALGATMYSCKSAAVEGEIVLSDTIARQKPTISDSIVVPLHA